MDGKKTTLKNICLLLVQIIVVVNEKMNDDQPRPLMDECLHISLKHFFEKYLSFAQTVAVVNAWMKIKATGG